MYRGHSSTILCFTTFSPMFFSWYLGSSPGDAFKATEPPNSWMVSQKITRKRWRTGGSPTSQNGQLIRMGLTLVISGWWFLGKILWKKTHVEPPRWQPRTCWLPDIASSTKIQTLKVPLPTLRSEVLRQSPWSFAMD